MTDSYSSSPNGVKLAFTTDNTPYLAVTRKGESVTRRLDLYSVTSGSLTAVGSTIATGTDSTGDLNNETADVVFDGTDIVVSYVEPVDDDSILLKTYDGTNFTDAAEALQMAMGDYERYDVRQFFYRAVGTKYYMGNRSNATDYPFFVSEFDTSQ